MVGSLGSRRFIRVGISSCLLGEAVRFDAGHKRNPLVKELLGRHFEWVSVCPEVESGMGIPREPVRLVGDPIRPRMIGVKSAKDHTRAMEKFSRARVHALAEMDLSGYILKSRSPSCGVHRVKLYADNGGPGVGSSRGIFARHLLEAFPWLPIEEEGRLNDARIRENFIERVFCYRRWRDLLDEGLTPARLVAFHTAHKVLLLAHSPARAAKLGRIVAEAKGQAGLARAYGDPFFEALTHRATPARHANALQHMAGHFKRVLPAKDRKELAGIIDDYRRGIVPLVVPVTLIRHFVRKHGIAYLLRQVYLNPHPKELMLRNQV